MRLQNKIFIPLLSLFLILGSAASGAGFVHAEGTVVELIAAFDMSGRVVVLLAVRPLVGGIEVVKVLVGVVDCSSPPGLGEAVLDIERATRFTLPVGVVAYAVGIHIPHGAVGSAVGNG